MAKAAKHLVGRFQTIHVNPSSMNSFNYIRILTKLQTHFVDENICKCTDYYTSKGVCFWFYYVYYLW